jgi:hypothetical protein
MLSAKNPYVSLSQKIKIRELIQSLKNFISKLNCQIGAAS